MLLLRLAWRNLMGAGLRTWLNVAVLSLAFVLIVWSQGLLEGMRIQSADAMTAAAYAGGQYWEEHYDPYDPFTLQDAHAEVPHSLRTLIERGDAVPILIVQGTMYPEGRVRPVLIKGVEPEQSVLAIPTEFLSEATAPLPALIGTRLARHAGLELGDEVTLQWRDANGTFDARDAHIVQIMKTSVQAVDEGQIWVPIDLLRELMRMPGEATLVTLRAGIEPPASPDGWVFRDPDTLLEDIRQLVRSKSAGSMVVYVILLLLAMLAIFDTQVLSIFRRRKEIGTLVALGLTRGSVIRLFTLEGALHGVLAALVGAVYGIPLLGTLARNGWVLPETTDRYGFAIGEVLYPRYGPLLVLGTTLIVLAVTTVVSYLPTRRIARLKPTDALRGRLT